MDGDALSRGMQDLAKQFASGFSGRLNFLATAARQWKAAFWFKQGRLANLDYYQQSGERALFNFCYDFGVPLMKQGASSHPLAPFAWVAEPEVFKGVDLWSWAWPNFWAAWQAKIQEVAPYQQKAPAGDYQLRPTRLGDQMMQATLPYAAHPLGHVAQQVQVLKSIVQFPMVDDLYHQTSWPPGELTRYLVELKQQGLIKAVRATHHSS